MRTPITSLQNARVKNIVKLNNRRHRDAAGLTVVEGVREVEHALQNGIVPLEVYICPPLLDDAAAAGVLVTLQNLAETGTTQLFEVTPPVFAKMAYREDSGGVLLVIPYFQRALEDLPLPAHPFLVVIEGGEKPGNLGAILRTADAAGVDGVILSPNEDLGGTDIHNPNVIRASLGAVFTVPTAVAPTAQVIEWLRQHGIRALATTPVATTPYTAVDMNGPVALIMGSEAHGLSPAWLAAADEHLVIPMFGRVDSLNLSVATALLLYEAVRQRRPTPGGQAQSEIPNHE